jgi:hypothetical protein
LIKWLGEWCYNAEDKKGEKRRELDVSMCFGPLLEWILAWWPADQPRLALALDATTLKKRFTVLGMGTYSLPERATNVLQSIVAYVGLEDYRHTKL